MTYPRTGGAPTGRPGAVLLRTRRLRPLLIPGMAALALALGGCQAIGQDPEPQEESVGPGVRGVNDIEPADPPVDAFPDAPGDISPQPQRAESDVPEQADDCHVKLEGSEPHGCVLGDPEGDLEVAVVGDSKAFQWIPALSDWAEDRGHRLRSDTKSACSFTTAVQLSDGEPYTACSRWVEAVAADLRHDRPDVVVVSGLRSQARATPDEPATRRAVVEGYLETLRPLAEQGTTVIALADTPQPGLDVPECVAEHRQSVSVCDFPEKEGLGTPLLEEVATALDGSLVDLGDHLCPDGTCRAVDDGVLTYRNGSHVTVTWVQAQEEVLGARLDAAIERGQRD